MSTLIMMSSLALYRTIYDNANTIEFRNPKPISDYFDKPIYYNKYNKPLNELLDAEGNQIDPSKVTIIDGFKSYTPSERAMVIQKLAKEWFVQWCEVAFYYSKERKKHINDDVWNEMCKTPKESGPDPPAPTPGGGSLPTQYASKNVFRIMPTPLLNSDSNDWYVLYEEEDLDEELIPPN